MTLRIPAEGYSRNIIQIMTLRISAKGYSRNIPSYSLITLCAILNFQRIYCWHHISFQKISYSLQFTSTFCLQGSFHSIFCLMCRVLQIVILLFFIWKVHCLSFSLQLLWLWYIKTCLCAAHIFLVNILCTTHLRYNTINHVHCTYLSRYTYSRFNNSHHIF